MKHEIKQSYHVPNDLTIVTYGRKKPVKLNLEALEEFQNKEHLDFPDRFKVIVDQRSPIKRIVEGDSFYNPYNSFKGKIEEAIHIPITGIASRRKATVQVQTWPINLRMLEESLLKHELLHLGKPIYGGINPRTTSLVVTSSLLYYFIEKAYPVLTGMTDNDLFLGLGLGLALGYNLTPPERAAIKAQFRKLSKPLLIKE